MLDSPRVFEIRRVRECSKRLRPGPVGRRPARLPAPAGEDDGASPSGFAQEPVREGALADAGLALEDDQPPATADRLVERGHELRQLRVPADERPVEPGPGFLV